ncbi:MAG: hypothetical protein AAGG01_05770 [Planctomycetota bacterium]
MSEPKRPHLAWTAAVVGALALLALAAWWLWAGSDDPSQGDAEPGSEQEQGGASDGASESDSEIDERTVARAAALTGAEDALEAGRFTIAAERLAALEERFGWSDEVEALSTRLELRESAYREALRPIEFRIESLKTEPYEIYARFSLEGSPVFATEFLVPDPSPDEATSLGLPATSHIAVLRTSLAVGATLELVEPGGLFEGERVVFGPVPLSPLPIPEGGTREFNDDDAPVRSLSIAYRPSPFTPGVHVDDPSPSPPVDATAAQLMDAVTGAIAKDDLDGATHLLDRLAAEHEGHSEEAFARERIANRRASLLQNRTRATFTIIELSVDPRAKGPEETALWATDGEAPSFRSSIRTTDDLILAEAKDGKTVPYLIPGQPEDAPPGNVLEVSARGSAPLTLVVKDSSPRFSTRVVGALDLPVTLAQLPRGTGTIVVERQPHVLVLPESDSNRIRRVVLRWSVARR